MVSLTLLLQRSKQFWCFPCGCCRGH